MEYFSDDGEAVPLCTAPPTFALSGEALQKSGSGQDDGLHVVLFHAVAVSVTAGEVPHGVHISLLRGLLIPLDRLCVILLHAFAVFIACPQIELCFGISLFCSLTVPLYSLRVILRYTFSVIITESKIEYEI